MLVMTTVRFLLSLVFAIFGAISESSVLPSLYIETGYACIPSSSTGQPSTKLSRMCKQFNAQEARDGWRMELQRAEIAKAIHVR